MPEYSIYCVFVRIVFYAVASQLYLGYTIWLGDKCRRLSALCSNFCVWRFETFVFVLRNYGAILDCAEIFIQAKLLSVEPCAKVELDVLRRVCLSPVFVGIYVLSHAASSSCRFVCLAFCRVCNYLCRVGIADLANPEDKVWKGFDRIGEKTKGLATSKAFVF